MEEVRSHVKVLREMLSMYRRPGQALPDQEALQVVTSCDLRLDVLYKHNGFIPMATVRVKRVKSLSFVTLLFHSSLPPSPLATDLLFTFYSVSQMALSTPLVLTNVLV